MRRTILAAFAAAASCTAAHADDAPYFHAGIQIEVKPGIQNTDFTPPIGGFAYANVKQISVRCFLNTNAPNTGVLLKIMGVPNQNEALFIPVTPVFADSRTGGSTYMTANLQPFYRFLAGAKYQLYGEFPDAAEGQCMIGMFGELMPKLP